MVRIVESLSIFIEKDSLSFLERYSMLPPVLSILRIIPLEPYVIHAYNVRIQRRFRKSFLFLDLVVDTPGLSVCEPATGEQ